MKGIWLFFSFVFRITVCSFWHCKVTGLFHHLIIFPLFSSQLVATLAPFCDKSRNTPWYLSQKRQKKKNEACMMNDNPFVCPWFFLIWSTEVCDNHTWQLNVAKKRFIIAWMNARWKFGMNSFLLFLFISTNKVNLRH